jgi:peptidyl-prolyl cis-trans isomerase SurA
MVEKTGIPFHKFHRIALALLLLTSGISHAKTELLDRVVAVVNDDVVMQSELDSRIKQIKTRLEANGTALPPEAILDKRVLDQLILESIELQLADKAGIRVSDNQLNQTMTNIAKQNGLTLDQFEKRLGSEGLSYSSARDQIRREMIISRIQQQQVDRRVRVTDQEVNSFLTSAEGRKKTAADYYLGHILIAVRENATPKEVAVAKAKAEKILKELKAGADFKQTAVAKSDGRNALQGGVIGWRKENELPSIAADIVPKLAIKQPSDLIKTSSGFHIIEVLQKRGGKEQMVQQTHALHILIKPSEIRTDAEAKEIIDKLYERIMNGDSFAELAKSNSDDPGSAIDGGDLKWVNPGSMVPEFEQVMDQTPVGQVSKPFRSQFGWHIVKVVARRTKDMSEMIKANQARQVIHRRKYEEELANWLLEIKGEAYIDIKNDSPADSGKPNGPDSSPSVAPETKTGDKSEHG